MKVKLNFKADKPTVNGHIYPEEVLKKAFDKKFAENNVFVLDNYNAEKIDLNNVIGMAKDYEIKSNSEILIDVKAVKNELLKIYLEDLDFKITMAGFGHIDEKTNTIDKDFKLSYFFIVGKNNE